MITGMTTMTIMPRKNTMITGMTTMMIMTIMGMTGLTRMSGWIHRTQRRLFTKSRRRCQRPTRTMRRPMRQMPRA